MKPSTASYLRRSQHLLRWIDRFNATAPVTLDGREIGTWQSIRAKWRVRGKEIVLNFRTSDRLEFFRIASIRRRQSMAEVSIQNPAAGPHRRLLIQLEESAADLSWPGQEMRLRAGIEAWVQNQFPQFGVQWFALRSDRRLSLSGAFYRIVISHGNRWVPILVLPYPDQPNLAGAALCQLLLWMIALAGSRMLLRCNPAILMLPSGSADSACHRASLLNSESLSLDVLEYDLGDDDVLRVGCSQIPRTPVEEKDFRWPVLGPFRWSPQIQRVMDLAPASITRYPRFNDFDSLRLLGLEFARAAGENREIIYFGIGTEKVELTDDNFHQLKLLVDEILYYRRPDSPDIYHPWYRLQAERWLESLILEAGSILFPELMPEAVYSQIPVYLGREAGRVDILGMDIQGRLIVFELKVGIDPGLPIQALDYWGRVVQHNLNGDFEKRGYFSGLRLRREPPRIYMVAPLFEFHDSTEKLLEFFNPEVDIWKIGINEDWRCGVKILRRVKLRCGGINAEEKGR